MGIQYDADELVELHLDKVRHLAFPVAALRVICKAAGEAAPEKALAKLFSSEDQLGAIATIVHAGLLHEDRALTREDVEWMLTPKKLAAATAALQKALMPERAEDADEHPPKASEGSA